MLCITFKIIAFFIITFFPGYEEGLTFYPQVEHTCIPASLIREIQALKTNLNQPLFIEVPVASQLAVMYLLVVSIFPLSTICLLDFGIVLIVWGGFLHFIDAMLIIGS